jgi:hypothetical protein
VGVQAGDVVSGASENEARAARYAARDMVHLRDIVARARTEDPEPPQPCGFLRVRLPDPGSGFPPGARVYIDGETIAKVREFYPGGSTAFMFPHYRLDVVGGDRNVAIAVSRVGVVSGKSTRPRK